MEKNIFSAFNADNIENSKDVEVLSRDFDMTMREIALTVENSELKVDQVMGEINHMSEQVETAFSAVSSCLKMQEAISNKDLRPDELASTLTRESSTVNGATGVMFFSEELTREASIGENLKKLWEILKKALKAAKDLFVKGFKKLGDYVKSIFNKKMIETIAKRVALFRYFGHHAFTLGVEEIQEAVNEYNARAANEAIYKHVSLMNPESDEGFAKLPKDTQIKIAKVSKNFAGIAKDFKIEIVSKLDVESGEVSADVKVGNDTITHTANEVEKKNIKLSDIVTKEQLEIVAGLKIFNHVPFIDMMYTYLGGIGKNDSGTTQALVILVNAIEEYSVSGDISDLKNSVTLRHSYPRAHNEIVKEDEAKGFGVIVETTNDTLEIGKGDRLNKTIKDEIDDNMDELLSDLNDIRNVEEKEFSKWSKNIEKTIDTGYKHLDKIVASQMNNGDTSTEDIETVKNLKSILDTYAKLPRDILAYKAITIKVANKYTELLLSGK